jgi:hypothetical protein
VALLAERLDGKIVVVEGGDTPLQHVARIELVPLK